MISVVVPAFNAAVSIVACIDALKKQIGVASDYEIIVVDDGSTDETRFLAEKAGVRVLHQKKRGPAAARNRGIREASGEIVCFTDADCIPTTSWLCEIVSPLLAESEIHGCKGIYCTDQKEMVARFVQLEYEEKYDRLRQHERIMFMDFYSAAFRRRLLLDNDGFDERFTRANSEDRELSYRLAAQGYQMVFRPTAVVKHRHARTLWAYFRKKLENGYWTAQAVRHFPERGREDSYTPQLQKAQIGLMGMTLIFAAASPLMPNLRFLPALALAGFILSTVPFLRRAWRRDRSMALVSPLLLAARALALGVGFCWGWVRPLKPVEKGAVRV